MPTDLPPDYKPNPPPTPGEPKPQPGVPEPGVDSPVVDPVSEPGGDVVDPPGWPQPPGVPGIDPDPSPQGVPTF